MKNTSLVAFLPNCAFKGIGSHLKVHWMDCNHHLQLPVSMMWGVVDSPYHWYAKSTTPRINDTQSRQLSVSTIRGVDVFFTPKFIRKKIRRWLSVSMMRRVGDSPYQQYAELVTLRINDTQSQFFITNISVKSNSNFEKFYEQCKGPLPYLNIQKNRKIGLVSMSF
jgi:hypothetical protein